MRTGTLRHCAPIWQKNEVILRILHDLDDIHVAIISCDPSRRKTGGALLGDRIRMNAIGNPRLYLRSLATRKAQTEIPVVLEDAISAVKAAGFDLIIAETAGIGQGDSLITNLVDVSIYVMTSEFGAASQLEKIDMLDFADLVAVNKFEKRGGEDAVRDVCKQVQRNRRAFDKDPGDMPVFGTIASKFNDDGVTALYHALLDTVAEKTGVRFKARLPRPASKTSSSKTIIIPPERTRYLSEIGDTIRGYHNQTRQQSQKLRNFWHLQETLDRLDNDSRAGDLSVVLSKNGRIFRKFTPEMNWCIRCGARKSECRCLPNPCPICGFPRSPCPALRIPASVTAGCGRKMCPADFLSPPAYFH